MKKLLFTVRCFDYLNTYVQFSMHNMQTHRNLGRLFVKVTFNKLNENLQVFVISRC